jgi:hypothetical protein
MVKEHFVQFGPKLSRPLVTRSRAVPMNITLSQNLIFRVRTICGGPKGE